MKKPGMGGGKKEEAELTREESSKTYLIGSEGRGLTVAGYCPDSFWLSNRE